MKNALILFLFVLASCGDTDQKQAPNPAETPEIQSTKPEVTSNSVKEKRYVNTTTRLNYRDKPNGKIVGKFQPNDEVIIVKHTNVFTEVKSNNKLIKGEWVGVGLGKDTVYVFDGFLSLTKKKTEVWSKFPERKMPLIDSTNFDNIKSEVFLNASDIKELQLIKLYPDLDEENASYKFAPSYRLNFGDFKSIVVNVFKGDHELEAVLIIYDEKDKLAEIVTDDGEHTNSVVLAYDEIAESWSRTTAEINENRITVIDALYTDTPKFDTVLYHVNRFGDINKVNTDFANNLRPDKTIRLNTVYTDTIQFVDYNDDGDYFFLEGTKNNKPISLIYNWDTSTEKYKFKENDRLLIKWKMGSIYLAGEGEALEFSEVVLEAEKL